MQNKLIDLNNHLFEELERLNDENLKDKELAREINRAKAMSAVAQAIIQNANLSLEAQKFKAETLGRSNTNIPEMLEDGKND